jgi:hypothetical protein
VVFGQQGPWMNVRRPTNFALQRAWFRGPGRTRR